MTISRSCEDILAFLDAATGSVNLEPIEFLLKDCVSGVTERAADAKEINDKLYCTWKEVLPPCPLDVCVAVGASAFVNARCEQGGGHLRACGQL